MTSDSPFFPNVPSESLALEHRTRAIAKNLDEEARYALYERLSETHARFCASQLQLHDELLIVRQAGYEIAFPRPVPLVILSHIVCGYREWLEHKYALPGFVEVEANDVVIDCGAYVGGFSLGAVSRASELHAFEPEHANFACLARNLTGSTLARLNEAGLYATSQIITLNISASSVEHSLLTPDDGAPIATRQVPVLSLADYCTNNGVTRIDFLKLEAEGVELEIFEGVGELRPRKLAIDVSPEREGQSPAEEFERILRPLGYDTRQRGHVMFARLV